MVCYIGLVPARLRVAQQEQAVDGPHTHIVDVQRRPGVFGEVPRDDGFDGPDRPCG